MAVRAFKLGPKIASGEPSFTGLLVVLAMGAHQGEGGGPRESAQSLAFGVQVGLEL